MNLVESYRRNQFGTDFKHSHRRYFRHILANFNNQQIHLWQKDNQINTIQTINKYFTLISRAPSVHVRLFNASTKAAAC